MKVIFSHGKIDQKLLEEDFSYIRNNGWKLLIVNHYLNLEEAKKTIVENSKNYDILIVWDNEYDQNFLDSLKNIYKVFYCVDDPYGSQGRSKPFVKHFDYSFSGAVMYDKKKTMNEKYKEWGAKKASWWPLGIYQSRYQDLKDGKEILGEKNTEIIFIGNPQNKTGRLLEIYRELPKLEIYGQTFGVKGIMRTYYHLFSKKEGWFEGLKYFDFDLLRLFLNAKEIQEEKIIDKYRDSKIGINMHQSSGPVNHRLFDLPANGVMQICDCTEGLGKVFEIDKEIVAYDSISEAISKIKFYLNNSEQREKIALAGWRRCLKDYKREDILKSILEKIKKGLIESGLETFKDGSKIEINEELLAKYEI